MLVLSGERLKEHVKLTVGEYKYRRKIVRKVYEDIQKRGKHILYSFTGDRRLGKTTSLLQLIDYFNDYDNSIFIDLEFDGSIEDVGNIIYQNKGKKIFIDEVTTERIENLYKRLADYYSKYSEFVVMTGTWSQIFYYYQHDLLLGRNLMYRLSPITPADMKLVKPESNIYDFIDNGGFIQDVDLDLVFKDSVDNFKNFLSRMDDEFEDWKIELSVIYTLLRRKMLSKDNFGNFLHSNKNFISSFKEKRGIINDGKLSFKEYLEIQKFLLRYDFVFPRLNLYVSGDVDMVPLNILTLEKIYNITDYYKDDKMTNFLKQDLFEKYLAQEIILTNPWYDRSTFLRKDNNEEIDIIDDRGGRVIEVKFSSNYNHKWNKHLDNNTLLEEFKLQTYEKLGVYLGETFETNSGVTWYNIYDFMKHIGREHLLEPVDSPEQINLNDNSKSSTDIFSWEDN